MSTTDRKTATLHDAHAAPQRKQHLGLAAGGAVVIVGLGAGLTALIMGVTGDSGNQTPSPNVPPSVEVPFDPSDRQEMRGIDNRLYELADQHRKADR